jgi:hypothetical protein
VVGDWSASANGLRCSAVTSTPVRGRGAGSSFDAAYR